MTDRNGNLNENSRSGSREDGRDPVRRNTAMNSREIMLEDEDYLERQKQIIRENVRKMLDSLKNKISSDDIDWLTEICDEVFKGKRFADEDFNSLIEDFNRSWEET